MIGCSVEQWRDAFPLLLTRRLMNGSFTTLKRNVYGDLDSPCRVEPDEVTIRPSPSGETNVSVPSTMALQQTYLGRINTSQDG